jgi:hypothetical protein
MEQRRDPRVPIEKAVNVTVLGEPETRLTAVVKNTSGRGLGLISSATIAPGAAVKIEIGDAIFLGEAMYSKALEEGGYFLGIELTQVLSGLAALSRMAEEFSAELEPAVFDRR